MRFFALAGAVVLSVALAGILFAACATVAAGTGKTIPLLQSEQTELLEEKETAITIRASRKNCAVFLNGEYQGNTPLRINALAPGLYHLHVEKDESSQGDAMISVDEGRHELYYVELSDEEAGGI